MSAHSSLSSPNCFTSSNLQCLLLHHHTHTADNFKYTSVKLFHAFIAAVVGWQVKGRPDGVWVSVSMCVWEGERVRELLHIVRLVLLAQCF